MTIGRQTAPERPAAAIAVARMEAAPAISASVHTGSPERRHAHRQVVGLERAGVGGQARP